MKRKSKYPGNSNTAKQCLRIGDLKGRGGGIIETKKNVRVVVRNGKVVEKGRTKHLIVINSGAKLSYGSGTKIIEWQPGFKKFNAPLHIKI